MDPTFVGDYVGFIFTKDGQEYFSLVQSKHAAQFKLSATRLGCEITEANDLVTTEQFRAFLDRESKKRNEKWAKLAC